MGLLDQDKIELSKPIEKKSNCFECNGVKVKISLVRFEAENLWSGKKPRFKIVFHSWDSGDWKFVSMSRGFDRMKDVSGYFEAFSKKLKEGFRIVSIQSEKFGISNYLVFGVEKDIVDHFSLSGNEKMEQYNFNVGTHYYSCFLSNGVLIINSDFPMNGLGRCNAFPYSSAIEENIAKVVLSMAK